MSTNQTDIEPGELYTADELPRNESMASGGVEFHHGTAKLVVGDKVYDLEQAVRCTGVSELGEVLADE